MYFLPIELQRHIYSFDSTYKEKFDIVLKNIKPKLIDVINYYIDNYCRFDFQIDYVDITLNNVVIYNNVYGISFAELYTENEIIELWKWKLRHNLFYIKYDIIKNYFINEISEEFYNEIQRVGLTLEETSDTLVHNVNISNYIKSLITDYNDCINNAVSLEDIQEYYYLNNDECEIITFQNHKYIVLNKMPETIL
jgi:hypothetical protein